jgi:hypothetical protein
VVKPVTIGWRRVVPTADRLALSADGRYLAFASWDRLVASDTDGGVDVYLWDSLTRQVSLISVNSLGQKANGFSGDFWVSISASGRFVTFESAATNLVPSGYQGHLFVRDRLLRRTECIDLTQPDTPGGIYALGFASISADGRFVAFSGMGFTPDAYYPEILVRDRFTGATELMGVTPAGGPTYHWMGYAPQISANGRFVAFTSDADDLAPEKTTLLQDVFVRDRLLGVTHCASLGEAGQQGNGPCLDGRDLALTSDGWYVAFGSDATNLTAEGTMGCFLRSGLTWP